MTGVAMRVFAILALAALTACGGGGGGSGGGGVAVVPPVNRAPIAMAGAAQVALMGAVVTLDGSGSSDPDGNTITYDWTLTSKPAGSAATLTGSTTARPSFRADKDGAYALTIRVSDGALSAQATVSVTAATDANDLAAATQAALGATLNGDTRSLQVQWSDRLPSGSSYRVDLQAADGTFAALETLAGAGGTGASLNWNRVYTEKVTLRVVALTSGREIPLLAPNGAALLTIDAPASAQITLDKTEPLSGNVALSVTPNLTAAVAWTIDLTNSLGSSTPNPQTWPTQNWSNGQHLLLAHVTLGDNVFVDYRRTVTTFNNNFAATLSAFQSTTELHAIVRASSASGIASVQASVDGGTTQTLTATNAGSVAANTANYLFIFNATSLGSGPHTVNVRVTDISGEVKLLSQTIQLVFPPVVSLNAPRSGGFYAATLPVQGSYTTDTGSPVTVNVSVGATPVLTTNAASFSSSFSLTGVTPGNYTLTLTAKDTNNAQTTVQRPFIVTSSDAFALQPFATVDEGASILAVRGDRIVYRVPDGGVHVRDAAAGTDVTLATVINIHDFSAVAMTDSWIYAAVQPFSSGATGGCPFLSVCIYRWSPTTGAVTNLSANDPNFPPTAPGVVSLRGAPVAAGKFVAWTNGPSSASFTAASTLYDESTGAFTAIPLGAPAGRVSLYALGLSGGAAIFYFSSIQTAPQPYTLHKWTAAAGTTTVTQAPSASILIAALATDGDTLVYQLNNSGGSGDLVVAPVAGGASSTLTNAGTLINLRDGVLLYRDGPQFATSKTMAWSKQQGAVQLAGFGQERGVGGGVATFYTNSPVTVQTWNGGTGVATIRAQGGPLTAFATSGWIYFKSGDGLYRVALN